MSDKRLKLALERQRLQLQSARLRDELTQQSEALLTGPLRVADALLAGARWSRSHPLVLAVLVGVVVALRPIRSVQWAYKGWRWWHTARRWYGQVQPWIPQRWRF